MKRSPLFSALVTLIAVAVVLVAGILVFVNAGWYNVAATEGHAGFVEDMLETTAYRSIVAHAEERAPLALPSDSATLRRGARAYRGMCAPCHGAPGEEPGWMHDGLLPEPPEMDLLAREMTPAQLNWVIENGLKFTGMPAMAPTHSAEEILEVTAFVAQMGEMTPEAYRAWTADPTPAPGADSTATADDGHDHTH